MFAEHGVGRRRFAVELEGVGRLSESGSSPSSGVERAEGEQARGTSSAAVDAGDRHFDAVFEKRGWPAGNGGRAGPGTTPAAEGCIGRSGPLAVEVAAKAQVFRRQGGDFGPGGAGVRGLGLLAPAFEDALDVAGATVARALPSPFIAPMLFV